MCRVRLGESRSSTEQHKYPAVPKWSRGTSDKRVCDSPNLSCWTGGNKFGRLVKRRDNNTPNHRNMEVRHSHKGKLLTKPSLNCVHTGICRLANGILQVPLIFIDTMFEWLQARDMIEAEHLTIKELGAR